MTLYVNRPVAPMALSLDPRPTSAGDWEVGGTYRWESLVFSVLGVGKHVMDVRIETGLFAGDRVRWSCAAFSTTHVERCA